MPFKFANVDLKIGGPGISPHQGYAGGGGIPYTGPDIVLIGYGQSNWLRHVNFGSSPEAAVAGTSFWDGSAWGAVPASNGARAMLNAIATETGLTVGLISGGQSGVNIAALQPDAGTGYFEDLAAQIDDANARGCQQIYIVFLQGEGDADSLGPPSAATYADAMDTLYGHFAVLLDHPKFTMPFICSSLAGWVGGVATDASWNAILTAQSNISNFGSGLMYYSHSNRRFPVDGDGAHWNTAAMYGLSGRLYAQTILSFMGPHTPPNWNVTYAEIVDATHTDVYLNHSAGNDFTPTSGITGFTLSTNGFSSVITPSAADRIDGETIRLTHTTLDLTSDRAIRYQYGKLPVITAPVLDNSPLAAPLNHTAGQFIVAEGSASLPVLTLITANAFPSGGDVQVASGLDLSPNNETMALFIAIAHQSDGNGLAVSEMTITPAGEASIDGYPFYVPAPGQYPYTEFWVVEVPAFTPGIDNAELSITLEGNPFSRSNYAIASVPFADLMATSPDSALTDTVDGTALTLEMSVNEAGFIFAVGSSAYNGATSAAWTGDEPPIEQSDYTNSFGSNFTVAIANGCAQSFEDNAVTVTYANSGPMRLAAIAIR